MAFVVLHCAACGMAERDDEDSKSYDYLSFVDSAFERYCLESFDVNGDGRLSRYEAESVREIACPNRGIGLLDNIDAFTRLERLDCSGNELQRLAVDENLQLQELRCAGNRLEELVLGRLRGLTLLDCNENSLPSLDVSYAQSLVALDCRSNRLQTLDVSPCSPLLKADVRSNPDLTTVYYRAGQQLNFDGQTTPVEL